MDYKTLITIFCFILSKLRNKSVLFEIYKRTPNFKPTTSKKNYFLFGFTVQKTNKLRVEKSENLMLKIIILLLSVLGL